jgi:hypothetical protein
VSVTFNIENIHIIQQSTSEFRKYQRSENHTLFRGVNQCRFAPSNFILGQYKRTLLSICHFRENRDKGDRIFLEG